MSTKFGDNLDPLGNAVSVAQGVVNPPLDMWDREHPRSFMALIPERWVEAFENARQVAPEYFELDERALYKQLRKEEKTPNAIVNTVRLRLWMEYDRCQAGSARKVEVFRVLGEVCRNAHFEKFILGRPERAAWLLCPPRSYDMKVDEALDFGMDKLRDILELDVVEARTDKHGNTRYVANVKLGELQAKIVNMLDVRKHGAARQRIDTRSLSVSVSTSADQVSGMMESMNEDALERQIRQLEAQERRAQNLPTEPPTKGTMDVADGFLVEDTGGGDSLVDVDAGDIGDNSVDNFGQ